MISCEQSRGAQITSAMSNSRKFVDTLGLFNPPEYPNSLAWSEDGTLAVGARSAITFCNPANLGGPRASFVLGDLVRTRVGSLAAVGKPYDPAVDIHHQINCARISAFESTWHGMKVDMSPRSIAWSPAGYAWSAGCLLAVVTNDHSVSLTSCRSYCHGGDASCIPRQEMGT